jgi:hypothetical protein
MRPSTLNQPLDQEQRGCNSRAKRRQIGSSPHNHLASLNSELGSRNVNLGRCLCSAAIHQDDGGRARAAEPTDEVRGRRMCDARDLYITDQDRGCNASKHAVPFVYWEYLRVLEGIAVVRRYECSPHLQTRRACHNATTRQCYIVSRCCSAVYPERRRSGNRKLLSSRCLFVTEEGMVKLKVSRQKVPACELAQPLVLAPPFWYSGHCRHHPYTSLSRLNKEYL